ncbi:transporter substrate-binding domain-containing protein [Agarivorans aestuarii]|uniref:Transporter substrate-binding domain-containing protein n=1 Tax=Agarivorans aestuarii TaxID=1563703 RepID=A0ABU7G4I1_9ALTE|nr:transporter substrate-binding domain-containing protein [Agarivorans aestuarii]MEE1674195.1 transporter substrate-binding domain-containing protein [Agarivorans aestuarii]
MALKFLIAMIIFICSSGLSAKHSGDFYRFYALNSKPAGFQEEGETKGYYVDILKLIALSLAVDDAKVAVVPYPRIINELLYNEQGVVISCLFPNKKFDGLVHQPVAVASFQTAVVSLAQNPFTWDSLEGKRVASLRGASKVYGQRLYDAAELGQVTMLSASNYPQALKLLKIGRIDGFAGNLGLISNLAQEMDIELAQPAHLNTTQSYITISIAPDTANAEQILQDIALNVQQLLERGEIQDIVESYLPKAIQER